MKRTMELHWIMSWRNSTDAQWPAIQAHSLTLVPMASAGGSRAALCQYDSKQGKCFTEGVDFFLKDIARKHGGT